MSENENQIEEEIETDTDDEFEYDENGDIIVPDVNFEDEEIEEESIFEEDEEETAENDETDEETDEQEEQPESNQDDVTKEMRERISKSLKKLGYDCEEGKELEKLEEIARELDGEDEEEPKKGTEEKKEDQAKTYWQNKFAEDLASIQQAFPQAKKYSSLNELEHLEEFCKLMDTKKYSAVEAYRQTHMVNKQNPQNQASKNHLQSSVVKGSSGTKVQIPKSELAEWRKWFPDKSDKEINEIYKQSL